MVHKLNDERVLAQPPSYIRKDISELNFQEEKSRLKNFYVPGRISPVLELPQYLVLPLTANLLSLSKRR